jgi:hypothetical protein
MTEAAESELLGSWSLVSAVQFFDDGERRDEFGPNPAGFLCYNPGGIVSATLGDSHRPRVAATDPQGASPEEYASAASRFIAYAGPFTVDPEKRTVTHHISISLYPNWQGEGQVRSFVVDGDRLNIVASPRTTDDGRSFHSELLWQRVERP